MYEKYCKLRDKKCIKDADVAKATGITKSTFSDWKSGRSKPKNEKLQKIADYFEVPLEYFTNEEHDTDIVIMVDKSASMENTSSCIEDILTDRDRRDINKDLNSIMEKLIVRKSGVAAYDGEDLSPEAIEKFRAELEIALKRLKVINKEKYNPNKNKDKNKM